MTNQQILAIQSYILACVKHEAAHYHDKSEALMAMIQAQSRMHDLLLDKEQSRNSAAESGDGSGA